MSFVDRLGAKALLYIVTPSNQNALYHRIIERQSEGAMIFTEECIKKLESYVYRLIDPRNGQTFYIGKGTGNRIFAHIDGQARLSDLEELPLKMETITAIKNEGLDVIHIIHRHGMTAETAFHVEAALIDAYPGLSNIQSGQNAEVGVASVAGIARRYDAPKMKAPFPHRTIFLSVQKSFHESRSAYEACRGVWRINVERARKCELVVAMVDGVAVAAFTPEKWLPATPENFPIQVSEEIPGRYGFVGKPASTDQLAAYIGKRLPDEGNVRAGGMNPVKYSYAG